jgi:hypothetical protein
MRRRWRRREPAIYATQYDGHNRGQLHIYRDGNRCSQFEADSLHKRHRHRGVATCDSSEPEKNPAMVERVSECYVEQHDSQSIGV